MLNNFTQQVRVLFDRGMTVNDISEVLKVDNMYVYETLISSGVPFYRIDDQYNSETNPNRWSDSTLTALQECNTIVLVQYLTHSPILLPLSFDVANQLVLSFASVDTPMSVAETVHLINNFVSSLEMHHITDRQGFGIPTLAAVLNKRFIDIKVIG